MKCNHRNKIQYSSKKDALHDVKRIKWAKSTVYKCDFCDYWHLTTKSKKELKVINRKKKFTDIYNKIYKERTVEALIKYQQKGMIIHDDGDCYRLTFEPSLKINSVVKIEK
jgi:hypothetical protein